MTLAFGKDFFSPIPLLMKGCCYQIGNGQTIRTRKDHWIPHLRNFRPIQRIIHENHDSQFLVDVLVDPQVS